MKSLNTFFKVVLLTTIIFGCSSSDDNPTTPNFLEQNALKYQDNYYELRYLKTYNEEGYISFYISNQTEEDFQNNVPFIGNLTEVSFDLNEADLFSVTTSSNIGEYSLFINGTFEDGAYNGGTYILNYEDPSITISEARVYINEVTETYIDLDFVATRVDGEEIILHYDGDHKML